MRKRLPASVPPILSYIAISKRQYDCVCNLIASGGGGGNVKYIGSSFKAIYRPGKYREGSWQSSRAEPNRTERRETKTRVRLRGPLFFGPSVVMQGQAFGLGPGCIEVVRCRIQAPRGRQVR